MSLIIKYDCIFNVIEKGIHCAIYTNGDDPTFDMKFDSIKDAELWIANIQRELLLAQIKGRETATLNQKVKKLEKRLFKT